MRLHSYVIARDYGFAPNPFFAVCTLATCKPRVRAVAAIGDWVIGTGSKERSREKHLVYAMRVTEVMSFDRYWDDPRFQQKKPNLRGSKKQAFGDNIYHRDSIGGHWCQANSHHSLANGHPNPQNVAADTSTNRVLLSNEFVYWGGVGPEIPKRFLHYGPYDVRAGRGHKNEFPQKLVEDLVSWIKSLNEAGFCGDPLDWSRTP